MRKILTSVSSKLRKQPSAPFTRRILMYLILLLVITVSLHLLLQALNLLVFHQQQGQIYELSNRFDLDDESSFPTWVSQALLFVTAAAMSLAAYLQTGMTRRVWGLLAAVSLIFSIDEVAALHEFILQSLHVYMFADLAPTSRSNAWFILLPLILLAFMWIARLIYNHLPRSTFAIFLVAGVMYISGAALIDVVSNTGERETFYNQGILIAAEETLELTATGLVLIGTVHYIETHHALRVRRALRNLKPEQK